MSAVSDDDGELVVSVVNDVAVVTNGDSDGELILSQPIPIHFAADIIEDDDGELVVNVPMSQVNSMDGVMVDRRTVEEHVTEEAIAEEDEGVLIAPSRREVLEDETIKPLKKTRIRKTRTRQQAVTLTTLQEKCKPPTKTKPSASITNIEELQAATALKSAPSSSSSKKAARDERTLPYGTSVDYREFMEGVQRGEQDNWTKVQTLVEGCVYGEVPKTSQASSASSSAASSSSGAASSSGATTRRRFPSRFIDNAPYKIWTLPLQSQMQFVDKTFQKIIATLNLEKQVDTRIVEECPRKHAYIMMSESYNMNIRQCRAGPACRSKFHFNFIMREYLSPSEYRAFINDRGREYPSTTPNYCYIDLLFQVLTDYAAAMLRRDGSAKTIPLPFRNICNQIDEYKLDAMIQPKCMSHTNTDINPMVFRAELPMSTAETTHGLTLPVRCFTLSQFVKEIRVITTPLGVTREINALTEVPSVIFTQHDTVVTPPPQIHPYKYMQPETSYIPGTADLLVFVFSRANLDHNVGYRRLQQYGRYINPDTGEVVNLAPNMLLHYWCGLKIFPWRYFFCPDLRETVAHLAEIVDVARINVDALLKQSPDDDSFFVETPPEDEYSDYLAKHMHMSYYVAMRLRMAMLQTLLAIYPDSKNTTKDITMHTRFTIMQEWNRQRYERYLYDEVENRVRENCDVDMEVIDKYSKEEIPYHLYSSDYQLYKHRMILVNERTPRQELRKYVPSKLRWIFAKFDKLRLALARNFHSQKTYVDMSLLEGSRYADTVARLPFLASRVDNVMKKRDHSVYVAALVRINVASHMHARLLHDIDYAVNKLTAMRDHLEQHEQYRKLERYRDHLRRRRYNLRLFIFTHLDLMQMFYDLNNFTDTVMFSKRRHTNVNYCLKNYDECVPYDTCMYHEGMLPDLSTMIYCIPFPCGASIIGTDTSSTAMTSQLHSVMRMLNFFMQRTCHARVNIKQHQKLCIDNPSYRKLTSMVLEICMLGCYQHSDHMPSFDQAVEFHKLFAGSFNSQRFIQWQEHHAALTMLAMREFTVFQVKLCAPYHNFLIANYPWWLYHCRQVYALTNVMRMSCASNNSLSSIQHAIQNTSKMLGRTNISPTILAHIDKYSADLVNYDSTAEERVRPQKINVVYTLCQQLHAFNALFTRQRIERQRMPHPLAKCIEYFVKLFPRNTKPDPQWLLTFNFGLDETHEDANIRQSSIDILKCIFNFIERGKLHRIKDALTLIPRRDYEIIDAYFFFLLTHNCVTSFLLSEDIKQQQIAAIHKRYDLIEGSSYSPAIYALMLAECCGTVKSYNTTDATPWSFGADTVGINNTMDMYVCKKRDPLSNTMKQSYRVSTQLDNRFSTYLKNDDETNMAKLCERLMNTNANHAQRRFFMQPRCEDTPITFISLIGKVVEITSSQVLRTVTTEPTTNAFTICTTCGGVMAFSTRMFGSNGLSCNECSIAHSKELHTPDCTAKYHKVKNDWKHPFFVVDDRPIVGTQELTWMYVCHHCWDRKTSGFDKFLGRILTASCLQKCKHFAKNRLQFDLDFVLGRSVNDLFDPETSNYAMKIYSASNRHVPKIPRLE